MSQSRARIVAMLVFGVVCAAVATGTASGARAKPSGGGGTSTSPAISLVNLSQPGASPSFGQKVTFKVSTTATQYPWVEVRCYRGGALVYDNSAGFFPSYMFSQTFTLGPTASWPSGAANCTASLESYGAKRPSTLATLSFGVSA